MPRFFVRAKAVTLHCNTDEEESVHSNDGLCKISRLWVVLLKYYRVLKMELPLPISWKLKHCAVIYYFTAVRHTASNVYAKNNY